MTDLGDFKRLRLRKPGRCATCQTELPAGVEALWYRGPKVVQCLDCADRPRLETAATPPETLAVALDLIPPSGEPATESPPVDEGVAGASALRKHKRLHDSREVHAREKLGVVGVGLARVIGDPQATRAWQKGGKGEAYAARLFEKHLAGSGVKLLHDRRVPGHGSANIDHIAIGAGGVTVIDTKSYKGKVRVERVGGLFSPRRDVLKINGRDQTKLIGAAEKQIEYVKAALLAAGYESLNVRGALCMTETDGLPLFGSLSVRGILVDGPKRAARLAKRPGETTPDTVDKIWRSLAESFPSA